MSQWLRGQQDSPYCVNCGRTYDMHVVPEMTCPTPECFICGGDGWIDGKDYPDSSYTTSKPCPNCTKTGFQP